jgi:hypothetical protein
MSEFEALLKSLQDAQAESEDLVKALPTDKDGDDKKVAEAADEDADDKDPDSDEGDEPEDKEPMTKSLVIDGEEYEAVDATDLIKSLDGRISATDAVLAKALDITVNTIKAQSAMIKSLSDKVDSFSRQGAGRKTVLTVLEKPSAAGAAQTLAKSHQQDGVSQEAFFLKANNLFDSKKLSGQELNTISVCLRSGQAVDEALMSKVINTNV